jgi:glutamine synthetase
MSMPKTFEYRAPDAFANMHFLFAALTTAIRYGVEHPKEASTIAEDVRLDSGTSGNDSPGFCQRSCCWAADKLGADRHFYGADVVFPRRINDVTIERLRAYDDLDLWSRLAGKLGEGDRLTTQYLHWD